MFTQEERKKMIGGSEIAGVMGLSRWKTPLKIWAEKTGAVEADDLSDNQAVQLGTELEEFVAQKFTRTTGIEVRRNNKTFRHPKYDYMVAHIDRGVTGKDSLLECKTCSAYKEGEWDNGNIPVEYLLQVMWYLGLTGKSEAYLAVLIGGQKFVCSVDDYSGKPGTLPVIKFDKEMFDSMVAQAKDLWENYIEKDLQPMAMQTDSETLAALFPTVKSEIKTMEDPQFCADIDDLQSLKNIVKEAQGKQKELEAKIKQQIGETEGILTPAWKITWKLQNSTKLNYDRMKETGAYDEYAETKEVRVLRVSKNRGAK